MATGVLKVRVGGSWIPIGPSGSFPAHAAMHMAGGADALTLDTLAPPTDVSTLNATTLAHGLLRKLSGSTSDFLRGDGTWAVVPINPNAASGPNSSITDDLVSFADTTGKALKDSGIPSAQVARLDLNNTFAGNVIANSLVASANSSASILWKQLDGPVDKKQFQAYVAGGNFILRSLNDAFSVQQGYLVLATTGILTTSSDVICGAGGVLRLGTPDGSWSGMWFSSTYYTITHSSGGQLGWWHQSGIFNLNLGYFRFNSSLLSIQNNVGTAMMTVRNDGVVSCPYYLVVPVGTDKWAPA
jgi:hypothetical protein